VARVSPILRARRLVELFRANLETLGATVILQSDPAKKPVQLRVIAFGQPIDCLVYLWNVTPGGNNRPDDEWRIQLTAGGDRFPLVPGVRTIIGGWNTPNEVWAFWDRRRHTTFSTNSPGLHIKQDCLEEASVTGIAARVQDSGKPPIKVREVVVSIAPRSLLWYVEQGEPLHDAGEDAPEIGELIEATPEETRAFIDESPNESDAVRRYDLVETMRAYRDARFRPEVLQAYSFRCAVCDISLKLVDAAHIIPVTHPKSKDVVTNGMALCKLHHAAYDNALVGVRSDYTIVVNPERIDVLRGLNLVSGLEEFQAGLRPSIRHPAVHEVRPKPENLIIGMQARYWAESHIG
jgi:putative restriction endonuclease